MINNSHLADRKYIISGFFIVVAIIYMCRLFYIQIVDDKYKLDARNNAFRNRTEYPLRGYIYDRNGKLLVQNVLSYDLLVTPKLAKDCDTIALCQILKITKEEFLRKMKKACQAPNSPRKESVFEKQLSNKVSAALQEKLYRFKGFDIQSRTVRRYPKPIAAHLLGYVGEVTKEKAAKDNYYIEGDYIGISGIEKSYEVELRGVKGKQIVMVDVHNKTKGRYMNGLYDTSAIAGKPLFSSIDIELQEYGEKLMNGKKGAIVAIEPSTGEILCLISSPGYDPNLLVGGKERSRNYTKLYYDSLNLPLFNRALTAMYPPGSIATSCNSYYSYVFREIVDQKKYPNFEDGYNHWRDAVRSFGPNTKLGTDLPFDKPGNVPSVEYYNKIFGKNHWRSNTVVSLGIGQAELTLVPLQMVNVVASIANRGYFYTPHCIKGVGIEKKLDSRFKEKHFTYVQNQVAYDNVLDGMQKCFDAGTATASKIPGIIACGKTGTAENPHGKDHAVFSAFAPRDNPKIAMVCFVENAGFGGTWAAPIVSLMIEKYLTGKVTRREMEKRMMEADLIGGKNLLGKQTTTPKKKKGH